MRNHTACMLPAFFGFWGDSSVEFNLPRLRWTSMEAAIFEHGRRLPEDTEVDVYCLPLFWFCIRIFNDFQGSSKVRYSCMHHSLFLSVWRLNFFQFLGIEFRFMISSRRWGKTRPHRVEWVSIRLSLEDKEFMANIAGSGDSHWKGVYGWNLCLSLAIATFCQQFHVGQVLSTAFCPAKTLPASPERAKHWEKRLRAYHWCIDCGSMRVFTS